MSRHVLVVGPTGVVGGAIARRLSANPEWQVTTAARRAPALDGGTHIRIDLLDGTATEAAFAALAAAGASLERVVLIGGGKSYGEHLGAYKTPAKESIQRGKEPLCASGWLRGFLAP